MKKSLLLSLLITMTSLTYGQEKNGAESTKLANRIDKESEYYGLIIGINQYHDNSLQDLDHPINGAEKLYATLTTDYNFVDDNIMLLKDATKEELVRSLDRLATMATSEDHVLFFFAGHGFWDEEAEIGYLLPADAKKDRKLNWMPYSQLLDPLRKMNSRHTLLIVDASFGGSIFIREPFENGNSEISDQFEGSNIKAITSCTLTDASDDGIFVKYLVKGLKNNKEVHLSSEQLYSGFREQVIKNSSDIPQFGTLSGTPDDGHFIFLKSK